ncbi:MAG: TIGR02594 family protein [Burkholderiaceae bacterium]|nr:TIGR02594 family protein [Burkholderiaceae bacterium]
MEPNNNERIYAAAAKHIGEKEIPGKASNPLIRGWIKLAAKWLEQDDSSTPWCGCFRGAVGLATATGVPPEHYRAKNWLLWGTGVHTIREALKGDTVVLVRKGGFHVGILDRVAGEYIYLLGGNQGDAVSIARFPVGQIEGIRRG